MIRAKVEQRVGQLSDEVWQDTCEIANSTLYSRRKFNFGNDLQYVLILCNGIADAINKGYIQRGSVHGTN